MKNLTPEEISKAVNGKLFNNSDLIIKNISTDSRKINEASLFIPLSGDNFDGHDYIEPAFLKGAIISLTEKKLKTQKPYILVENTKQALMDLAEYYLGLFDVKVVAVTGSSGKTTTKDLIHSVLKEKYKTHKTEGNFNNEIGLPLTVFNMPEDTEIIVLEMGMNHFGEIHNLSKIAKPDVSVITNIGSAHMEFLGSREGIFKAKSEIFDFLKPNGIKILNGEDDYLPLVKDSKLFGLESKFDYYAEDIIHNGIKGSEFTICGQNIKTRLKINGPGRFMILNCLAAAAVGDVFELNKDEIKTGIENADLTKNRMEIKKTDRYTIINDVYNANPDSMKASIDVLAEYEGNKVCILGDMLELGENSDQLHYEIGDYAYKKGINVIVSVGKKAYNIYEGSSKHIVENDDDRERAVYFEEQDMLLRNIDKLIQKGDCILVKASRGMSLEKTVENLLSR